MEKKFICINCPMGCRLTVTLNGNEVEQVEGNTCAKGVAYAKQEAVSPMRMVTALMRMENRDQPLSVKTSAPVPKKLIFRCVNAIYDTHPSAPVFCGDVLLHDLCGTGVDVVATQDIP